MKKNREPAVLLRKKLKPPEPNKSGILYFVS